MAGVDFSSYSLPAAEAHTLLEQLNLPFLSLQALSWGCGGKKKMAAIIMFLAVGRKHGL